VRDVFETFVVALYDLCKEVARDSIIETSLASCLFVLNLADQLGVDQAVNTLCESYLGPGEPSMARTAWWRDVGDHGEVLWRRG
jgi:hypothetical protein